jgi:hypothetical protein
MPARTPLSRRLADDLVSNFVSIVFQSRPVTDAIGAPVLRDQGPDRPSGHAKADHGLGHATPFSQSQIS